MATPIKQGISQPREHPDLITQIDRLVDTTPDGLCAAPNCRTHLDDRHPSPYYCSQHCHDEYAHHVNGGVEVMRSPLEHAADLLREHTSVPSCDCGCIDAYVTLYVGHFVFYGYAATPFADLACVHHNVKWMIGAVASGGYAWTVDSFGVLSTATNPAWRASRPRLSLIPDLRAEEAAAPTDRTSEAEPYSRSPVAQQWIDQAWAAGLPSFGRHTPDGRAEPDPYRVTGADRGRRAVTVHTGPMACDGVITGYSVRLDSNGQPAGPPEPFIAIDPAANPVCDPSS